MVRPVWDPSFFIDAFCERRTAALWDEPLNMATNLVFMAACLLLVRRVMQLRAQGAVVPVSAQALIALIGAMAVSSAAFHMSATRWAGVSDAMAVRLFALAFIGCYLRWLLGWSWMRVALLVPPCAAVALLVPSVLPDGVLHGAAPLLPGLFGLMLFATVLAARGDEAWRPIALASISFAIAIFFHRADRPLCSSLPVGTHFLWHVFAGITAYLMTRTVLERAMRRPVLLPARAAAPAGGEALSATGARPA